MNQNEELKIGDNVLLIDQNEEGIVKKIEKDFLIILTEFSIEIKIKKEKVIKTEKIETDIYKKYFSFFQKESLAPIKKTSKTFPCFICLKKNTIEVDLHLEKILENTSDKKKYSNYEMLLRQLVEAKKMIHFFIKEKKYKKLILIHGNGKKKLRHELESLIKKDYPSLGFLNASYQKYGWGAMEIFFKKQ